MQNRFSSVIPEILYEFWRYHPSLVILSFVLVALVYFFARPQAVFRFRSAIYVVVLALSLLAAYSNLIWIRKGPIFQEKDLLDLENPAVKDDLLGRRLFGKKDTLILVVRGQLSDAETLRQVLEATDVMKKLPWVISEEVKSLATLPALTPKAGFVNTDPLLKGVPQGEREMETFLQAIKDHPLAYGLLVSKNLDFALVVGPLENGYDQQTLYRKVEKVLEERPNWGASGYPYIRETTDVTVTREIFQRSLGLGLLGLAFVLVVASGGWGGLLIIAIVLLGILWTRATIGLTDYLGLDTRESVYTHIVYVTHLVAATSPYYLLQSYKRILEENPCIRNQEALLLTLQKHRVAIFLVDLVPIIGFGTLLTFEINTLREFGEYMALGIAYILLLTFSLFPLLLERLPRRFFEGRGIVGRSSDPLHAKLEAFSSSLAQNVLEKQDSVIIAAALALAMLFAVLAVWVSFKLRVGTTPLDFIPSGSQAKETALMLNHALGIDRIYFLADSGEPSGVFRPDFLQAVARVTDWIEKRKGTGFVESPVKALKAIHRAYNGNYDIPETAEANAQLFFLDELSPVSALTGQIDSSKRYLTVGVYTPLLDDSRKAARYIEEILNYARAHYPDIHLRAWGHAVSWIATDDYVGPGKTRSIILSILVVFLSITAALWLTGSPLGPSSLQGLFGSAPLIIATILTLTLVALLGYRMDLATAPTSAVAIGIASDAPIFVLTLFRQHLRRGVGALEAISMTVGQIGKVVFFNAVAYWATFLPFLWSSLPPVRNFGGLVILNITICSVGTLVLLPALLKVTRCVYSEGSYGKTASSTD